jgi:hypothetical protein
MNKTTQVPTEWLEELISINTKRINAKVNQEKDLYLLLTGELESHIKASKYFQQPDNKLVQFNECLRLLRDLADFQNGAPLEQHKVEYEKTMDEVWAFLKAHENDSSKPEPESLDVDLEEFNEFVFLKYFYNGQKKVYFMHGNSTEHTFSEVLQAFKKSKG